MFVNTSGLEVGDLDLVFCSTVIDFTKDMPITTFDEVFTVLSCVGRSNANNKL